MQTSSKFPSAKRSFPLFNSHIDMAHSYWKRLIHVGDLVVDATCGNGHDSLVLAQAAFTENSGTLIACDRQVQAIDETRKLLTNRLTRSQMARVELFHRSHEELDTVFSERKARLIVFNLGYLPGGDKSITTLTASTLNSVTRLLPLLMEGGVMSITCYPGHEEGKKEEEALLEWSRTLPPDQWSCCHHQWLNRTLSPSLLIIQRGGQ